MLCSREKFGKSTLANRAAADVTRGRPFAGEPTVQGAVLLLALEKHIGDVARRLVEFDADPTRLYIVPRVRTEFSELEACLQDIHPVLTIVDTLPALVERRGSGSWQRRG